MSKEPGRQIFPISKPAFGRGKQIRMGERLQQLVQPNTAISVLLTEDGEEEVAMEMMRKLRQEGEVVVDVRAVVKGEQS